MKQVIGCVTRAQSNFRVVASRPNEDGFTLVEPVVLIGNIAPLITPHLPLQSTARCSFVTGYRLPFTVTIIDAVGDDEWARELSDSNACEAYAYTPHVIDTHLAANLTATGGLKPFSSMPHLSELSANDRADARRASNTLIQAKNPPAVTRVDGILDIANGVLSEVFAGNRFGNDARKEVRVFCDANVFRFDICSERQVVAGRKPGYGFGLMS